MAAGPTPRRRVIIYHAILFQEIDIMPKCALMLLVLVGIAVTPVQALTVNLIPSANPVMVGDTFTLDVTITDLLAGLDPMDAVIAFGFNTSVDDPSIALVSATLAAPFDVPLPPLPDTEVAGLAFPLGVQNDPLTLATLTFQALNPGTTNVGIVSDILTNVNHGLFFALTPDPVDITAAIAITVNIPEPTTMLLLGTSLLGLLACGWRRAGKM
jgi:hypothetical protein